MTVETLIIGAGMAGTACARALADAGQAPRILDKGRGIGGRMATRRVSLSAREIGFDHGAQYMSAKTSEFAAFLSGQPEAAALWADGTDRAHHVGVPGMSGLPRAMAAGVDVHHETQVIALEPTDAAWQVLTPARRYHASRVVVTVPAPQVPALIGADHPLAAAIADVEMAPGLTLMAAFPPEAPRPFVSCNFDAGPLAYIAQDSTKPGRADCATTWVAQASVAWSAQHLERKPADIAARLLALLCDVIGADPAQALHTGAHRWRYSRAAVPLGKPYLRSDDASLYLGGDWCLGPDAEDAWRSGTAIAGDILERCRNGQ